MRRDLLRSFASWSRARARRALRACTYQLGTKAVDCTEAIAAALRRRAERRRRARLRRLQWERMPEWHRPPADNIRRLEARR